LRRHPFLIDQGLNPGTIKKDKAESGTIVRMKTSYLLLIFIHLKKLILIFEIAIAVEFAIFVQKK
jgi:hypothetical protein